MRFSTFAILSIAIVSSSYMLAVETAPFEITAVMRNQPDNTMTTAKGIESVETVPSMDQADVTPSLTENITPVMKENGEPIAKQEAPGFRKSLKEKFGTMLQNMEKKVFSTKKEAGEETPKSVWMNRRS
ncbi:hypothetical protein K7432_008049 [Basidiobolus ranarum]|uniref:Uncharacterized protein n=1 Tax=Basidiobolus ranarum TaxID=34480 RepID=A0ABR2W044_9FUNG